MTMMQIDRAYCGYVNDSNLLKKVASGGFATEMAKVILKEQGVVFGVRYSPDFYGAEYCVIENIEDIKQLSGSKYIVPKKKIQIEGDERSVFEWAGHFLLNKKKVLFIGVGCDIGALYGYLRKNEINSKDLYTIDLICHGPTLACVQASCVHELEKKYNSKVIDFSVRYKKDGWVPPYLHAEFESGKIYNKPFYDSDFGFVFENLIRKSCYNCHFKGDKHMSDLTIGDYWGISEKMEGYNKNGVSIIISRSEKGENLVKKLQNRGGFELFEANMSLAIDNNPMYCNCKKRNPSFNEEQFLNDLEKKGLHYATFKQRGIKKTILIFIKKNVGKKLSINTKKRIIKILKKIGLIKNM